MLLVLKLRKITLSLSVLAFIHIDPSIHEFAQVVLGISPLHMLIAFGLVISAEPSSFSPLVQQRYRSNTYTFPSTV